VTADHPLLTTEVGHIEFLLGNEAIARGAIEAGVGFACGYPGTPSTEVTDTFALLAPALGIPFEYSVNEKVALEMAFAASLTGARSIVAMKHLGLMSAGDPLATIPYVGVVGGMVIVSAGDPQSHTSPNEQDQRHLSDALHIPMFDPRTPQEALEVTRYAFEVSERSQLPVIVRPTTRVCHTSAPITFGPIIEHATPGFQRDPSRFLPVPSNARRMRVEINDRLATAAQMMGESGFFDRQGDGRTGVVASGAPTAVCSDLMKEGLARGELTLLSLGTVYPLPEGWLVAQLRELDMVMVVEELSPYLEDQLRAICTLHGLHTKILGKRTGHLPTEGEYQPELIQTMLYEVFGIGSPARPHTELRVLPQRAPTLCAACPHRSAFFAVRSVFGDEALYFNDIGCYTLGIAPPLNAGDALLSMGAGFTLAAGVARTTGERTVGFLGDSTFFHSGMPALLNVIKEDVNMVAVIMDNEVTAMTGFQESPGIEVAPDGVARSVSIEEVVRALGAPHVDTIDPNDLNSAVAVFERAKQRDELSVVITQRACPIFHDRAVGHADEDASGLIDTYAIDHDLCQHCGRTSCGQRCDQGVVEGFERAMARARSLEVGNEIDRPMVASCATACPLYLCIQGYSAHIAAGRYEDALELIMDGLPLPDSVCRVCHRPCESSCVRAGVDEPVAINDLKRFVMDWADGQDEYPYQPRVDDPNGLRVAVVGAGPAGLAASHELAKRGYEVSLFDSNAHPGGLLRTGIPAYRLPTEVLDRDVERILDLGVHFEGGRRLGADLSLDELLEGNDAVLVALGGGEDTTLNLPGTGPEVVPALAYLRDRSLHSERVLVVGGGNSAIDAARTAVRRGADDVVIGCLESRKMMPAIASEIAAAEEEGVRILSGIRATGLLSDGVEYVKVETTRDGSRDPDDYVDVADSHGRLEVTQVIVAIGQTRLGQMNADGSHLDWSQRPVEDDETGRTSHDRIFAAGDLVEAEGTVTGAIAGGIRAAWGIDRSLRGAAKADERMPPPPVRDGPKPGRAGITRVDKEARHGPPELRPDIRIAGFAEVAGALTEEHARAEAARCMICGLCGNCNACVDLFGCPAFYVADGLIEIDPGICVACGVCAQFCPNDAIHPVMSPRTQGGPH
jgi:indolepyruvate ferredoxin oxidoreductase alpha subunit